MSPAAAGDQAVHVRGRNETESSWVNGVRVRVDGVIFLVATTKRDGDDVRRRLNTLYCIVMDGIDTVEKKTKIDDQDVPSVLTMTTCGDEGNGAKGLLVNIQAATRDTVASAITGLQPSVYCILDSGEQQKHQKLKEAISPFESTLSMGSHRCISQEGTTVQLWTLQLKPLCQRSVLAPDIGTGKIQASSHVPAQFVPLAAIATGAYTFTWPHPSPNPRLVPSISLVFKGPDSRLARSATARRISDSASPVAWLRFYFTQRWRALRTVPHAVLFLWCLSRPDRLSDLSEEVKHILLHGKQIALTGSPELVLHLSNFGTNVQAEKIRRIP
ncbi:hypothetical protein EDB86DRAFT_3182581 [Lactarius hatsudake]|nr:hypothetical protein EDB86DRAFT_3182581 [Lactarius hatsudake]